MPPMPADSRDDTPREPKSWSLNGISASGSSADVVSASRMSFFT